MSSATNQRMLLIALLLPLSGSGFGCDSEDPIHASLLESPSPSEDDNATALDDTAWGCPLDEQLGWIEAQTEGYIWIREQQSPTFDVWLKHSSGTLVLAGKTIPPETWAVVTGEWIAERSQLLIRIEVAGHVLEIDADKDFKNDLRGWFTADTDHKLFFVCDRLDVVESE